MFSSIFNWTLSLILKFFGLQRISEEKTDLEKRTINAVEQVRKQQKKFRDIKQDKWERASNEEKKKLLLDRFNDNDSGD